MISLEEVRILERWRPNVLLTGVAQRTAQAFEDLSPSLRTPIVRWRAGRGLTLPPRQTTKSLIVTEASLMSADEQDQLLQWMRRDDRCAQVITISSVRLFDLIARGAFSDSLYYLLNIVHVDVDR